MDFISGVIIGVILMVAVFKAVCYYTGKCAEWRDY
jgi:hypothetical protein